MLAVALLTWWYGLGWQTAAKRLFRFLGGIGRQFSMYTLIRTLFSPWKQLVADQDPNRSIGLRLKGVIDNLISRFVGFGVRIFTLIAALVLSIVISVFGVLGLILWPIIPLSIGWFLLKGVGII